MHIEREASMDKIVEALVTKRGLTLHFDRATRAVIGDVPEIVFCELITTNTIGRELKMPISPPACAESQRALRVDLTADVKRHCKQESLDENIKTKQAMTT